VSIGADQSQQCCQEAVALTRQVGHTPSVIYAEYFLTTLCRCRRDAAVTYTHAEALMALAHEQGFLVRFEEERMLRGWALAQELA